MGGLATVRPLPKLTVKKLHSKVFEQAHAVLRTKGNQPVQSAVATCGMLTSPIVRLCTQLIVLGVSPTVHLAAARGVRSQEICKIAFSALRNLTAEKA
eukprot:5866063-Amphidinium_carterae.1